jgi:glutamate racemase
MIGILDWGIGGFGFRRALLQPRPTARVLYFSDSGFTPYGKVAAPLLKRRVREVLAQMRERGATRVVIACNAASTVLPALGVHGLCGVVSTRSGDVEVTGVIAHAIAQVRRARLRQVAIIGGARTIRSGAYSVPLRALGIDVHQRIAQPLSARVERGELDTPALHRELRAIVRPLRSAPTLLLACTHYAALSTALHHYLPDTKLVDPIEPLTTWVCARWRLDQSAESDVLLTTGNARAMQVGALAAFGMTLARPKHVAVDEHG